MAKRRVSSIASSYLTFINLDAEEDAKLQEIEDGVKGEFLYRMNYTLPNLTDYTGNYIKVLVESQYLTNSNPAIIKREIWGNDIYSSDSDVVCILQHAGVLKLNELPPEYAGLAVYFKVSRNRNYTSQFKNGIRSRKLQASEGHSLKFETAVELYDLGNENRLVQIASQMIQKEKTTGRRKQKTARKALSSIQDMSIVFNLSGEPMHKFNLGEFGDKRSHSMKVSESIKNEVLYLESMTNRYELSYNTELKSYQIKEVIKPLLKDMKYMKSQGVPLPSDDVEVKVDNLKWKDILWGNTFLKIEGNDFFIPYLNGYFYIPIESSSKG